MPPALDSAPRLPSSMFVLTIHQQPQAAKAMGGKVTDRKPVDPPPIINLRVLDPKDPTQNYLQSPYYLTVCTLWHKTEDRPETCDDNATPLAGTLVSSLHKLKDIDNRDKGFFVFGDVSVRCEGEYRLKFVLFEMLEGKAISLSSIISDPFSVFPAKSFPGLSESSHLSRSFGDQGVRLRIRKDGRSATKRNAKSQNVAEENGYENKSQHNTPPGSQHSAYGDGPGYSRSFGATDHQAMGGKRQRTSTDLGSNPHDRDWALPSAPSSAGLYPPSTNAMPAYTLDVVAGAPSAAYGQNSLYQRGGIHDFANLASGQQQQQQQLAYSSRNYSQSDQSSNIDQYSDSTYGSHDNNPTISPTGRNEYSHVADPTLKSSYRHTVPSNVPSLPPPLNTLTQSTIPTGSVPANYGYNFPNSTRGYPQSGTQPNMRSGFSGYPGQYPMQTTPYQST